MTLLLLLGTDGEGADLDLLYKPIRNEIARLLRSRTTGNGGELGEFVNADDPRGPTNPTADEVDLLIDDAASLVASKVGINLPEVTWPIARRVVSLQTVLLIEAGSEQFIEARYDRFERMFNAQLATLVDAVQDAQDGDDPGEVDDRASALGTFPAPRVLWDCEPL